MCFIILGSLLKGYQAPVVHGETSCSTMLKEGKIRVCRDDFLKSAVTVYVRFLRTMPQRSIVFTDLACSGMLKKMCSPRMTEYQSDAALTYEAIV